MLLFIQFIFFCISGICNFKTSYVTVYLRQRNHCDARMVISKHRMLLFIKEPDSTPDKNPGFQNIVCYCLSLCDLRLWNECFISKHRMLLFILFSSSSHSSQSNFKTSYVTVYRYEVQFKELVAAFQNIVCYCLSEFLRLMMGHSD